MCRLRRPPSFSSNRRAIAVAAERVTGLPELREFEEQVVQHRARATPGEIEIERLGAARIHVDADLDLETRPLDQDVADLAHDRLRLGKDGGRAGLEFDVALDDVTAADQLQLPRTQVERAASRVDLGMRVRVRASVGGVGDAIVVRVRNQASTRVPGGVSEH